MNQEKGFVFGTAFGFDSRVIVRRSGEVGGVAGVSLHKRTVAPMYFVEYTSADGRAVEGWFNEDELAAAGGNDE